MLENLINSPFLTSLALTLLHFLWQGVLVAAVLKSALLIFSHNKPQLRYALSSLAMLANLLLPIITFFIIYLSELSSTTTVTNALAINELIQELKQPDAFFSYKELIEYLPTLLPYLSILWLAAVTLLAGKLLIEIVSVNKLPQQGALAPSGKLQARFDVLVQQINLTITPRLLISLKVDVPMAIGWLKPVVLLPANMITGLNSAQLEMLILHELAHIKRHDYIVNFLQTLVEILLFFHPSVVWVSKQMRNEREYCSDDIAVQHCGDAVAYAHTLADTASLCTKAHQHTIPDMAMAASGGDLKQRVIRLVDHHCAPNNNISKWFASATIVFSVILLSSKQLLTMPLIDIWHNGSPWQQPNKSPVRNAFNNEFPSSSIAQQLLTPENNEQIKPTSFTEKVQLIETRSEAEKVNSGSQINVPTNAPKIEVAKRNRTLLENQQKTTSDTKLFNKQLNSLSSSAAIQTQKISQNKISSNSLMVEEAFKRTDSNNPYQDEIAKLANSAKPETANIAQPINKVASLQQESTLSKTLNSNNYNQLNTDKASSHKVNTLALSPTTPSEANSAKQKRDSFTHPALGKEKASAATEPVWISAQQLKSVDPVYPSAAKRKGIEIEIKVNFTIDADGQIKNINFARQNKINYFKGAIRSAIKQWRFLPAKVNEQPVESQMSKVFVFSLHG